MSKRCSWAGGPCAQPGLRAHTGPGLRTHWVTLGNLLPLSGPVSSFSQQSGPDTSFISQTLYPVQHRELTGGRCEFTLWPQAGPFPSPLSETQPFSPTVRIPDICPAVTFDKPFSSYKGSTVLQIRNLRLREVE